jgi:hypothetical protein
MLPNLKFPRGLTQRLIVGLLSIFVLIGFKPTSYAHSQSTAFLTVQVDKRSLHGEWHLALRDLQDAIGLDSNDDGLITWEELRAHKADVCAYAIAHLHVQGDSVPGVIRVTDFLVDEHSDGGYAVLRFVVDGLDEPANVTLNYQAFFDIDPKHRGLFRLESEGASRLAVFSTETTTQQFALKTHLSKKTDFWVFVREGIWHIWLGYDHILFLLALLLPGVLRRTQGRWEPVIAVRPAIANVLKVVTAFTLAHSITLSLAVLGIVHLPTRLVESAIAASVVLAALNNLVSFFPESRWMVAFGFGLLHGFGFANALRDLGLPSGQMALTLFGFNMGVEIGQIAIVTLFLPLALSVRHMVMYPRLVLRFGSASIMIISATWLMERVLDFKWLPF